MVCKPSKLSYTLLGKSNIDLHGVFSGKLVSNLQYKQVVLLDMPDKEKLKKTCLKKSDIGISH